MYCICRSLTANEWIYLYFKRQHGRKGRKSAILLYTDTLYRCCCFYFIILCTPECPYKNNIKNDSSSSSSAIRNKNNDYFTCDLWYVSANVNTNLFMMKYHYYQWLYRNIFNLFMNEMYPFISVSLKKTALFIQRKNIQRFFFFARNNFCIRFILYEFLFSNSTLIYTYTILYYIRSLKS